MKKLHLFLILLFLSGTMFAQQLSYRLANPRIIRVFDAQYFEFDVQIKCSQAGAYLWTSTVKLNFNNTTFTPDINFWGITKIGLFATNTGGFSPPPKYTVTPTITGIAPNKVVNIGLTGQVSKEGNGPNAADFVEVPTVYTTLLTIDAPLADITGDALAGINFWEAGMNGFQQYITGPTIFTLFTNPNLYDSRNFLTDYTGRFFSTLYGWSQIGGSTNNVQYLNWATPVSTTVWEGAPAIPSGTTVNNLIIDNPATLTIPQTGQLTVTGNTNVQTPNGLTILSDATGTGSLITGTSSGVAASTVAQRWMTAAKWNIVSSPVSGQTVANFLTNNPVSGNNGIAVKGGNVGILEYLSGTTNAWSLASTTGPLGNLGQGKGFSMRLPGLTTPTNDGSVTFNGVLQAGTVNPTVTPLATVGYWNCIGNPFTSAIRLTSNTAQPNFLTANAANLVSGSGIYVWEAPDTNNGQNGHYTTYSNAVAGDFQQGQAFLVNVTASPLNFTSAMQIHSPGLALKSTGNIWPTIKIEAVGGEQKSSTIIAFNSGMTKGLDPTYDASLLKGGSDMLVYSRLVEDNSIPFAIQALPDNEFSNMVIPVGIDFKTGGQVVFSAELMNLPSDCKVILEDKLNKTFTDLSENDYTVTIAANSSISDRFQLHTSNLTTGITDGTLADKLSAYAFRNIEIRVKGNVSKQAVATLYDIQGRAVVVKNLEEGSLNTIPTPNIKTGIYMLYVKDNGKVQGFKIPVTE